MNCSCRKRYFTVCTEMVIMELYIRCILFNICNNVFCIVFSCKKYFFNINFCMSYGRIYKIFSVTLGMKKNKKATIITATITTGKTSLLCVNVEILIISHYITANLKNSFYEHKSLFYPCYKQICHLFV